MRIRTLLLPLLFLPSLASCGSEASSLVGRWRAPDGQEVEFFEDGAMNLPGGIGARYQVVDEGHLRVEQEMIGPVTLHLELMGDSFRVQDDGVLGRGTLLFFRDTGALRPTKLALAETPTVQGTCTRLRRTSSFLGGPRQETRTRVPLAAVFASSELTLDPLTHGFEHGVMLELREADAAGSGDRRHGTYRGRYVESAGAVLLRYEGAGTLKEVEARRDGDHLVIPGAELFGVLMAGAAWKPCWEPFVHNPEQDPSWGDIPDLTLRSAPGISASTQPPSSAAP